MPSTNKAKLKKKYLGCPWLKPLRARCGRRCSGSGPRLCLVSPQLLWGRRRRCGVGTGQLFWCPSRRSGRNLAEVLPDASPALRVKRGPDAKGSVLGISVGMPLNLSFEGALNASPQLEGSSIIRFSLMWRGKIFQLASGSSFLSEFL